MEQILSVDEFTPEYISNVFDVANEMREAFTDRDVRRDLASCHVGRIVASLFYEPSNRARFSFESAAKRLGASVIGSEDLHQYFSSTNGETSLDTLKMVGSYSDVVVLGCPNDEALKRAASEINVPVINGGQGSDEDPIQGLADLYTIFNETNRTGRLNIVVSGDLWHEPSARSFIKLASRRLKGSHFTLVSSRELAAGKDIERYIIEQGADFTTTNRLYNALPDADVLYMTPLQKVRVDNPEQTSNNTVGLLELKMLNRDAILLHPLPRGDEISALADKDPRSVYFNQSRDGHLIRMAVLDLLLSPPSEVAI